MKIRIYPSPEALGKAAAAQAADIINQAIERSTTARIVLSTGASQFPFFSALAAHPIDWNKVEVFHLDEYIGIDDKHIASFRKYLRERFVSVVNPGAMYYVSGEGDVAANIAALSQELLRAPIDLGMIGIGENGHLAFNDPPADFDCGAAYKIVELSDSCKAQQVREGWFPSLADVPQTAISMTIQQILKCEKIISVVPHAVKADAVRHTVRSAVSNLHPSTILRTHADVTLYLDADSAAQLTDEERTQFA